MIFAWDNFLEVVEHMTPKMMTSMNASSTVENSKDPKTQVRK
jgi:hypothetical protein